MPNALDVLPLTIVWILVDVAACTAPAPAAARAGRADPPDSTATDAAASPPNAVIAPEATPIPSYDAPETGTFVARFPEY